MFKEIDVARETFEHLKEKVKLKILLIPPINDKSYRLVWLKSKQKVTFRSGELQ